ncbi:pentapeptide repeat-containing protein [Amycolatopsis thermalba]|uniref:Pentapeptide repeat-containing protein n=1 Tax=Amycolatopsis thermalba TaxID=944492 RepID=A0ABY4P0B8_9PSEU|nr:MULTISPECIES: pentapeptide repeat-containing protein [Amycolatopsis]UQS25792.1 pentapeptide repeat-containing protein [Amycolatopsis thermalba]
MNPPPSARRERVGDKVLSNRTIALCAAILVVSAAVACWLLLRLYGHGTDADKARLDGIRTVGTIVLGAGGAVALLLAARKQQTAEHDLATKRHDLALREQANEDARHDAAERRITDLYLKAVEQLGSEKAPVRLAGLHALDRLAQDNPAQRQRIVDVITAYLRMPYALPEPAESAARERYWVQLQEREVRLTAQRILTDHLDPLSGAGHRFWPDIDLDLSGALLIDFTLRGCQINNGRFVGAEFAGRTLMLGVSFVGDTHFGDATFSGDAWFVEATFNGNARFDRAEFAGDARFDEATFVGATAFRDTTFLGEARFDDATLSGNVVFSGATFTGNASFRRASFTDAWLPGVEFSRDAYFDRATFAGDAWFSRVAFSSYTTFDLAVFTGDIRFSGATLDGVAYQPPQLQGDDVLFDQ